MFYSPSHLSSASFPFTNPKCHDTIALKPFQKCRIVSRIHFKKKGMSSDIVPLVLGPFLLLWYPSRHTYSLLYFKWLHEHIFSFLSYSLKYWLRHTQFTAIQPCSSILQLCAFAFQDLVFPSVRNGLLLISDFPLLCPWGVLPHNTLSSLPACLTLVLPVPSQQWSCFVMAPGA